MKVHCFFEQSGVFKNEFIKLGYESFDYDILNQYNQTDYQLDLFTQIVYAYDGYSSIFDNISSDDLIFAFFPCTYFENQSNMIFKGNQSQLKKLELSDKIKNSLFRHSQLSKYYQILSYLILICLERHIKLIIENPYSTQHYLIRYFPLEPTVIDFDRTLRGDYFKKPTMYYFINIEKQQNMIFEPLNEFDYKKVCNTRFGRQRSEISSCYANRFIREFIL